MGFSGHKSCISHHRHVPRLSSSDWHAVGRYDPSIAKGGQHTNVVGAIGGTIDVDVEASAVVTAENFRVYCTKTHVKNSDSSIIYQIYHEQENLAF